MDVGLELAERVVFPLVRLLATMAIGLLIASLVEALHWTRFMAKIASPLVRLGHLQSVAGASFSLAFFSPAAANALLASSYEKGEITRKEMIFSNLFNSSPAYLVHLPTLFSVVYAFLGAGAFIYIGLTFFAATLRTLATVVCGRIVLPPVPETCVSCVLEEGEERTRSQIVSVTLKRFKKRIVKLFVFTIPAYIIVYAMQKAGWFEAAETFMATYFKGVAFIRPEAFSIIALNLAAESGVALSAAASLAHTGALTMQEIIMALLVGNIISSPMRAFRHQFPSYSGYFDPSLAFILVIMNQICRVASLLIVTVGYYHFAF